MKSFLSRLSRLFGSFGLAIVILLFLFVLTAFGTWEQHYKSIYDVQREYFESLVVIPSFFPLPLPGAYLLLSLLAVNLVVGGLIRIRKRATTVGVIIAHLGILSLLIGGFVEYQFSSKGSMLLFPDDQKGAYQSYYDWDVVVTEYLDGDAGRAYVVPQDRFGDLGPTERATFRHAALPFDVEVLGYQRNARPSRAEPGQGVDGFMLRALAPEQEAEHNRPGVYVNLSDGNGVIARGLLWAEERGPFQVETGGRQFGLTIARRTWPLPFEIRLDRFVKSDHPGTAMAREYSSYVRRFEGGAATDIHITMNEPMRHEGYTFYQSSYVEDRRSGRTATVLSVVKNPADGVPAPATWVIFIGLLVHFVTKLVTHIQGAARRSRHAAAA